MALSSTLYERNLLYQQLNFKYVLTLYLHSIVWKHKPIKGFIILSFFLIYLLDFFLGVGTLIYITKHPSIKNDFVNIVSLYIRTLMELSSDYITWLMGVPWGIKLNTPLSQFLGTRYLYILNLWKLFYSEFVSLYLTLFVNLLLVLLPFGVTISITALHDFLKFLNLCLICFFVISSRVFALQISALKSLGRLFMGWKWNILRKRVDSCEYDMNQLLFGTVIFTILLFLLPTTGMYLLAFLYLRLMQFTVQFSLRLCSVFVNKLTVWGVWWFLNRTLKDQPITQAKVLIRGLSPTEYASRKVTSPYKTIDEKWSKVELFSVDDDDIKILWNDVEYSVEEMREIIKDIPAETIMKELNLHGDGGDDDERDINSHSMMYWFGVLPNN